MLAILVYVSFATWLITLFQKVLPNSTIPPILNWIVLVLSCLYLLVKLLGRAVYILESLLPQESILINNQAVTIDRSGFRNLEQHVVYPADSIRGIHLALTGAARTFYLTFTPGGDFKNRFKMVADPTFCRGISDADALDLLGKIQQRFPRYRDIQPNPRNSD